MGKSFFKGFVIGTVSAVAGFIAGVVFYDAINDEIYRDGCGCEYGCDGSGCCYVTGNCSDSSSSIERDGC